MVMMLEIHGAGLNIHYNIFDTSWGPAGVGWSERGVCAVGLPGPAEGALIEAILDDYPDARPGDPGEAAAAVGELREYFGGGLVRFKVKLDLSWATPFQRLVYEALGRVPYGATAGYGEVARAMGRPGSARAVGSANAKNRVPIIIPCHRVVRSDGAPGGFSGPGGTGMKQRLIAFEKKNRLGL